MCFNLGRMNMKKIVIVLVLALLPVVAKAAQGFVQFFNSGTSAISTNTVVGGSAAGLMAGNSGQYYFALYCSTNATSVNGRTASILGNANNSYAFNDGSWSLAAYATNGGLAAGRFLSISRNASGNTPVPVSAGLTAQFVVIGWSANIGMNIAAVQAWYNNGSPVSDGWIGQSVVSGALTVNDTSLPGTVLFGANSPQIQGFTLGLVSAGGASIAPYIVSNGQPTNTIGYVGSSVSFKVSYSASPTPVLQWQFNGTNIDYGTNAVLTLNHLGYTNAGNYSVIISNSAGSVTSSTAVLTVQLPPGYIYFNNNLASISKIFTNTSVGGPITGLTATNPGLYCYALFGSVTTTNVNGFSTPVTGVGANSGSYAFSDPAWTLLAYGTNTALAGRFASTSANASGYTPVSIATGPGGTYASFVVLGWSANIGTTIASVQSWYNNGSPASDGWIGQSGVSGPLLLGDASSLPPAVLFASHSPQIQGFNLGLASPNQFQAYAMTYVPPPVLTTTKVGNSIKLSWPASYSSYGVQSATGIAGPWDDVAGTPTTEGTNLTVTIPVSGGQPPYFRLIVK